MQHEREFYIGGAWVRPRSEATIDVIDPATEAVTATIAIGSPDDVDDAVRAARRAFDEFSSTSVQERLDLLDLVIAGYRARRADLADAITREMGAPAWLARSAQVGAGTGHLVSARNALAAYEFERQEGTTLVVREPIGVCALITPWNWPLNQIAGKVGPALAAGCTMVLKPSEVAPLSALIFAEIIHDAGVPAGVFNLVNGTGADVGTALSAHADIDMVSFTGSTRAGIEVARTAAPTIKRVTQELGGKSANIVLDDADFEQVIARDLMAMCINSGQSCNAPTRMLVPRSRMDEAAEIAGKAAAAVVVGTPSSSETKIGPVASEMQFERVQAMIATGIEEGARLVVGGTGRPPGLDTGYYVQPTVFADVTNDMTIAREEIFGPVLVLIGYEDDDDAVRIANDSPYGLAGYVSGKPSHAREIARRIRSGQIGVNGNTYDADAPFGGYRRSGNGREAGIAGLEEFLETKAILGYADAP